MAGYDKIPSGAKLQPKPFKAHVDDEKLQHMKDLLKLSPIGPAVWENTSKSQGETHMSNPARKHGMRRDWLSNAKDHWLNKFDWRQQEEHINSFPQFTVPITDDDGTKLDVHFMALFSENPNAVPIGFYHGWPGSFLEFLKLFDILRKRYAPKDLPYHVVAPSLVGYAYTTGPSVESDYDIIKCSSVMHKLMCGLGFESGYLSQGGDLGSFVSRIQSATYDECKSAHVNMLPTPRNGTDSKTAGRPATETESLSKLEETSLARGDEFNTIGRAYASEHGTRTGTIGLVLSSSPLAMLAWIGEKFLEWTDQDPSIDEILASVSLYWLTDTFPRCIYPYRGLGRQMPFNPKPSGYSYFPKEILPCPESWAHKSMNVVASSGHTSGGHFAAMEKPEELLADVDEWVKKVWKSSKL